MANHKKIASLLFKKNNSIFLLASLLCSTSISYPAIAQADLFYNNKELNSTAITSLMSATTDGDLDGVKFFVKSESSTINQKNIGGATALHLACRSKNFEIAKVLVENGADVNAFDLEGWTPLMRASLAGEANIVSLLLDNGANVGAINSFKDSAIIHAAVSNCNDCLSTIFEKSAIVKATDLEALKQQIHDAFVIARNHDNRDAQTILSNALDDIIRFSSPVVQEKMVVDEVQPNAETGDLKAASLVPITLIDKEQVIDVILNDENISSVNEKNVPSKQKSDDEIFKENKVIIIDESRDNDVAKFEENKVLANDSKKEDSVIENKSEVSEDKKKIVVDEKKNLSVKKDKTIDKNKRQKSVKTNKKETLKANSIPDSKQEEIKKESELQPVLDKNPEVEELKVSEVSSKEVTAKKVKFKFSQGPIAIKPQELNIPEPQNAKKDAESSLVEVAENQADKNQDKKSFFSSIFGFFSKEDIETKKEVEISENEEVEEAVSLPKNDEQNIVTEEEKPGFFARIFGKKSSLEDDEEEKSDKENDEDDNKNDSKKENSVSKLLEENSDEEQNSVKDKKLGFFSRLFKSLFSDKNEEIVKNEETIKPLEKPKKFKLSVGESALKK